MKGDRLLAHYDQIAEAPDAIARLRRFVLDLAVRGKLVPQDPKDEPASELLKRITKEKARLVKEGGFNSLEDSIEPSKAEPFAIPSSWAWCLLDDIAGIARGGSPRPIKSFLTEDPKGIPWIKIGDSTRGTIYIDTTEERIKPEGISRSRLVVPGDLLLSNSMSFGHPYITNISGCIHDGWLVIRTPENQISKLYIHSMFLSEYAKQAFSLAAAGAVVQNLNAEKVRRLQVPLPPLAEQHRIVAKVDELMALCDRLEAARARREGARDRLAAASLARLSAPKSSAEADADETFQADARFALDTLPALTARPDQIKALRQTILNLAVRGKLVPQDANDEPASELLKRIAKEIALQKGQSQIGEPLPYSVPEGWAWINLGRLVAHSDAGWSPKTEDFPRSGDAWGVLKVSAVSWDKFRAWENKQVLKGTEARLQAEVKQGDFLISRANTAELIARAVIVDEEPVKLMMSDKIVRLFLSKNINHRFVWIVNNHADFARAHYVERASGVSPSMKNVSRDVILGLPFPLPPLAEQHRIVAKVDALMALCDQLEASLAAANSARARLLDALLAEALAPVDQTAANEAA